MLKVENLQFYLFHNNIYKEFEYEWLFWWCDIGKYNLGKKFVWLKLSWILLEGCQSYGGVVHSYLCVYKFPSRIASPMEGCV